MLCLKVPTDPGWAAAALRDVDGVLVDHAHCEMKAASNALSLAARHPDDLQIVRVLADLARDEIDHFRRVLAVLAARGVTMGPPPVDVYAAELRRAAGDLPRDAEMSALVDRLLVGAMIEARSCERFKLLASAAAGAGSAGDRDHTSPDDASPAAEPLAALEGLWGELLASEARHCRVFVDLAVRAAGGDRARVEARLDRLAQAEATIVASLAHRPSRATIHG